MKLLDGVNIKRSNVEEVIAVFQQLTDNPGMVIVTDSNGTPLERIKLFSQKLTDSSEVQTVELHFQETL